MAFDPDSTNNVTVRRFYSVMSSLWTKIKNKIPAPSTTTPVVDGTATKGTDAGYARGDHVHPTDTSREAVSNKKTTLNVSSNTEFPTSKAVATFVNSSIATATANFLGTYDVVADLGLTTAATNAQIATALGSHTWPSGVSPTNNDYVFVSVDDPGTTTESAEYRRFKYNGSSWSYEYTLNNSSFTQAQWDAINSGVTASFVTNAVTGVKGSSESTYRTGQVSISKTNVGLGSVVNTGDSATPVSGGTTKFTTGGAYTELAKKAPNDHSSTATTYGVGTSTKYGHVKLYDSVANENTDGAPTQNAVHDALAGKVDKETGKGLSTNDYTTTEKNKLAGIAEGAEVNVQADWNVTDSTSDAFIKNKPYFTKYIGATRVKFKVCTVTKYTADGTGSAGIDVFYRRGAGAVHGELIHKVTYELYLERIGDVSSNTNTIKFYYIENPDNSSYIDIYADSGSYCRLMAAPMANMPKDRVDFTGFGTAVSSIPEGATEITPVWVANTSASSGTAPVKVDAYGTLTAVPMDTTPTANSTSLMTSGAIKTALDGKVNIANTSLESLTTTLLAQVQAMAAAGTHYARFYTKSDGGSANISDKPESGSKGFVCEVVCKRYVGLSDYRYNLTCWVQGSSSPYIATVGSGTTSITWTQLSETNHTHTTSIASDSSSGTVVTLAHDTQYKLTAGGTSVLFKTPADSNTDTKVTQTVDTSNDAAYPILAKNTTATSTVTDTSRFTSGVTLNPKNKSLTATTFIGALSGNASTATKPAVTFLDSTKNLNDYKGSGQGDLLWYRWAASSTPTNVPYGMEGATAVMSVLRMHNTYVRQTVYIAGGHIFTRFFNSSSWSEWDKIYDVTGMAYNYYVQGNIKGTNSTNKYKLLATLKPHLNTQDQLIAVFRVNFFRNNGLEDYADLIINSTCTNSTTPAYTIRAEMLKYGHEVNHAEIKLYQSTATDHVGEVLIYAYAPDTTSNDWGHISLNCLSVNRLYSAEIIRQWVYFEGNGDITGSAPSNATAVTYDVETVVTDADITTGTADGTIAVAGNDVAVKGLGTAAYTASGNYMAAKPNISSTNMNLIAAMGNCGGMASLTGTDTTINPNGKTGWHHFLNLSYTYQSTNMWQTQIANAAGTTDLWVRSRGGGTVTDGTAWAAPWTRILTGSNWSNVVTKSALGLGNVNNTSDANKPVSTAQQAALDGKVSKSGDTMTGRLTMEKMLSQVITGTGTAASKSGSTCYPAKWTFNLGVATPTAGDRMVIKIPIAGSDYGVYLSTDNGTTYYPVARNVSVSRLTTHYPLGAYICVIFETYVDEQTGSGQVDSIFPLAGGTARVSQKIGCWRVINDYDSGNSNTEYIIPDAYCGTDATAAAKTGTCVGFNLTYHANIAFRIYFTKANTKAAELTLSLNSTTAKPLYINGTPSSSTNYTIPIGVYWCYYDGTQYQLWTDKTLWASNYRGGNANLTGLVTLTRADNAISIAHGTANKYAGIQIQRIDTSTQMSVGISSSNGTTHGIYSNKHTKWIVCADADGLVYLNQGNTTANVRLGNTDVGSSAQPVYIDDGQIKACTMSSLSVGSATTATNANNVKVTTKTDGQIYLAGALASGYSSGGNAALYTDTGIYATATSGQLHATTFDVNSKCTLQFNTTTNALDFVFA